MWDLISCFFELLIDTLWYFVKVVSCLAVFVVTIAFLGVFIFGWLHTWWFSIVGLIGFLFFATVLRLIWNI